MLRKERYSGYQKGIADDRIIGRNEKDTKFRKGQLKSFKKAKEQLVTHARIYDE